MTRIFVDIDCLFDTRLGTLVNHDIKLLDKVDIQEYLKRPKDVSPYIPLDNFSELYAKRDVSTLRASKQTLLLYGLSRVALALEKLRMKDPSVEQTRFYINFHPYDVSEEEMDLVCGAILDVLPPFCTIDKTSISLKDMTPKYLDNNVDCWYVYEFNNWLIAQEENLKTLRIPTLSIMTPRLFAGEIGDVSLFSDVEIGLSQSFKLHYQPVDDYSLFLPPST